MPPVNALVMVHGMVPDPAPSSPFPQYEAFWQALLAQAPALAASVGLRAGVQWGHEMPALTAQVLAAATPWGYQPPANPAQLRPDERLTDAQIYVGARVDYSNVRSDPSPQNHLLNGPFSSDVSLLLLRPVITYLRENTLQRGFGDAVYYCSAEGERATRLQVYSQILTRLDALAAPGGVRLHLIGHSLGATVAHDFLYGLFAPNHTPDFLAQARRTPARAQFERWRERAQDGRLTLGSFVTMGSQLPLFVMRTQALIDRLAANTQLDPGVLGIAPTDPQARWVNFYDIDDMLGFTTRRLYQECPALVEVQVDSNDLPDRAHIDYWVTPAVVRRTADLLAANCV